MKTNFEHSSIFFLNFWKLFLKLLNFFSYASENYFLTLHIFFRKLLKTVF